MPAIFRGGCGRVDHRDSEAWGHPTTNYWTRPPDLSVSVATPAEPRGDKKLFFVQILDGEKLLKFVEKCGEIFLSGLRGAKTFLNTFRIVFWICFRVFQTVFRIDLKVFRGQFHSADMPPWLSGPAAGPRLPRHASRTTPIALRFVGAIASYRCYALSDFKGFAREGVSHFLGRPGGYHATGGIAWETVAYSATAAHKLGVVSGTLRITGVNLGESASVCRQPSCSTVPSSKIQTSVICRCSLNHIEKCLKPFVGKLHRMLY